VPFWESRSSIHWSLLEIPFCRFYSVFYVIEILSLWIVAFWALALSLTIGSQIHVITSMTDRRLVKSESFPARFAKPIASGHTARLTVSVFSTNNSSCLFRFAKNVSRCLSSSSSKISSLNGRRVPLTDRNEKLSPTAAITSSFAISPSISGLMKMSSCLTFNRGMRSVRICKH